MNSVIENDIQNLIEIIKDFYLKRTHIKELFIYMDSNITWLSPYQDQTITGIQELKRSLEQEINEYPASFALLDENITISLLSQSYYFINGYLHLQDDHKENFYLHLSIVCLYKEEILKIIHAHFSTPDSYYLARSHLNQETLRLSLERHKIILEQTTDIIFEWDIEEDTLYCSSHWRMKFGYDAPVNNISQFILLSSRIHPQDLNTLIKLMEDSSHGITYNEIEIRIKDISHNYIWCRIRATTQFGDNHKPIKVIGVIIDISREKQRLLQLKELAEKDSLTNLYNKKTMSTYMNKYIDNHFSKSHTLLIIDIDNFKSVNDNYGHPCGDLLLQQISKTLQESLSPSSLIGRLGGDEFIVYIPHMKSQEEAKQKASSLLNNLCMINLSLNHNDCHISCSIGGAICFTHQVNYDTLYQYADRALYHRKNSGKCGVSFYDFYAHTCQEE